MLRAFGNHIARICMCNDNRKSCQSEDGDHVEQALSISLALVKPSGVTARALDSRDLANRAHRAPLLFFYAPTHARRHHFTAA